MEVTGEPGPIPLYNLYGDYLWIPGKAITLSLSGSAGKESACNAGDLGSIPGLGRSPGEGKGYPLQESGLENFQGPWGHKESDMTE